MKHKTFETFWKNNNKDLRSLLIRLKKQIDDDMRQEPEDLPCIQITISIDEDCTDWNFQSGDNSYSGACYGDRYWGIGYLYRRSNTKQLAEDLISDLANQIEFTYQD